MYSRSGKRDVLPSSDHVELLHRQQRRLIRSVQEMASVISKYEDRSQKPAADFDVLQLLDKYAPNTDDDANELETSLLPDEDFSGTAKRHRGASLGDLNDEPVKRRSEFTGPSIPNVNQRDEQNLGFSNRGMQGMVAAEPPFTIEPGPAFFNDPGTYNPNEAYDAMLQFYQLTNNNNARVSEQVAAALEGSELVPPMVSRSSGYFDDHTQWLMNLVDWRASLENFPNGGAMEGSMLRPDARDSAGSAPGQMNLEMDFSGGYVTP